MGRTWHPMKTIVEPMCRYPQHIGSTDLSIYSELLCVRYSGRYSGCDGDLPPVRRTRPVSRRTDVEIEDGRRQVQRAARVRDIDDAADAPLDRSRAEQQVGLLAGEAPLLEVSIAFRHARRYATVASR